jgi:hypothetical protein
MKNASLQVCAVQHSYAINFLLGEFTTESWVVMSLNTVVVQTTKISNARKAMGDCPSHCLLLQVDFEDEAFTISAVRCVYKRGWCIEAQCHGKGPIGEGSGSFQFRLDTGADLSLLPLEDILLSGGWTKTPPEFQTVSGYAGSNDAKIWYLNVTIDENVIPNVQFIAHDRPLLGMNILGLFRLTMSDSDSMTMELL